jgi:hypothetical protein
MGVLCTWIGKYKLSSLFYQLKAIDANCQRRHVIRRVSPIHSPPNFALFFFPSPCRYVNDELRAHPDKPYGDGITAILQVKAIEERNERPKDERQD